MATLAILQEHLLTEDHARLFAEEFERETRRLGQRERCDQNAAEVRLKQLETELANLYQNLLAGLASPALRSVIADREAEKARLGRSCGGPAPKGNTVSSVLPPHGELRASLDNDAARPEAAEILSRLIESITIYPDELDGPQAEVVAKVENLIAYATNYNAAREGGVWHSVALVAGARSHFDLLFTSRC